MTQISTEDLAPAVEKLTAGDLREAIALLAGVIGSMFGGPFLGAAMTGSVKLVLAEVIANSAEKRMCAEAARLDNQVELAEFVTAHLQEALNAISTKNTGFLQSLREQVVERLSDEQQEQFIQTVRVIRDSAQQQADTLSRVEEGIARIRDELAVAKGVPIQALAVILERFGEQNVPPEEIPLLLARKADEFVVLRAELQRNELPSVAAVQARSLECLEHGDLKGARKTLHDARERIGPKLDQLNRDVATLLADEAAIDRLERRYRDAAQKFGDAAHLVGISARARSWLLRKRGDALLDHGLEFGDTESLALATDAFRESLEAGSHDRRSDAWWQTQNELGTALATLGERVTNGRAYLYAAMDAFQVVLRACDQQATPQRWAQSHINIGSVAKALAERYGEKPLLHEAVKAFETALSILTMQGDAGAWATAQNNLGATLCALAEHERNAEFFESAAAAFRAALTIRTRDAYPRDWVTSLCNLANSLQGIARLRCDPSQLHDAVDGYRMALTSTPRTQRPLQWGTIQYNLSCTLMLLGDAEADHRHLGEAKAALNEALSELRQERVPLQWAKAQANLGLVHWKLAVVAPPADRHLEMSAAENALRAALTVLDCRESPEQWMRTQLHLVDVLMSQGLFLEAANAGRTALDGWPDRSPNPERFQLIQNLVCSLNTHGSVTGDVAALNQAISCCRHALAAAPMTGRERGMLLNNLGWALGALGNLQRNSLQLQEAVVALEEALAELASDPELVLGVHVNLETVRRAIGA